RELLARRQVDAETARHFTLGYAPGGANLVAFLAKRNRSLADAEVAGLVRGGRDFFQRRLMVPIRDERGQVVAFTGRTVLGEDQVRLLKRYTDELVLTFDNDRAGRTAAERAIELCAAHDVRTKVARIEGEAKDPDEYLRGGGHWEDVLRAALSGWERLI